MFNTIFIIYAADQNASTAFYEAVLKMAPTLHVPGMTEFQLSPGTKLGIMPESGIEKIICPIVPSPAKAAGIPRCELYFYVDSPQAFYDRALQNGAKAISEAKDRDWGDSVAYAADPDGHIIAFARRLAQP